MGLLIKDERNAATPGGRGKPRDEGHPVVVDDLLVEPDDR
jgi:hypothetical protein